jgi:hypothetical protein
MIEKKEYKLRKLIFKEELKFPINQENINNIDDPKIIRKYYEELKKTANENNFIIKAFDYQICTIDVEVSTVLHIVDDNDNKKIIQRAIFSNCTEYIGINMAKISEGLFIIFYVYAK